MDHIEAIELAIPVFHEHKDSTWKTLGEALKEAGFATGSFIANGYVSDKFGFKQGWDYYTNYIREKKTTDAEKPAKVTTPAPAATEEEK